MEYACTGASGRSAGRLRRCPARESPCPWGSCRTESASSGTGRPNRWRPPFAADRAARCAWRGWPRPRPCIRARSCRGGTEFCRAVRGWAAGIRRDPVLRPSRRSAARAAFFFSMAASACCRISAGRLLEAALAGAAKVVRRLVQGEQRAGLLGQRGVVRKIVAGEVGKAEIVLGGEFPGQRQLNGLRQRLALGHQLGGRGLFKLQQEVGGLDLDPLARIELDLGRGLGFGQDAAGHEFAGFFKQCVHGGHSPMGASRARRAGLSADKIFKNESCLRLYGMRFWPFLSIFLR
jgi:hypothetical protein